VFSIVVLLTTKSILRDIVHVLMERTPPNMDVPAVARVSGASCACVGTCVSAGQAVCVLHGATGCCWHASITLSQMSIRFRSRCKLRRTSAVYTSHASCCATCDGCDAVERSRSNLAVWRPKSMARFHQPGCAHKCTGSYILR
jgi:hypothetical protein